MTKTTGDYFKDKAEAVEFYKNNTDSLKDKPDWLIEAVIDFACQYPNYHEYLEVENKVKNGQELTPKQKKKYGHLSWKQQTTKYKKDQVLYDNVEINQKGEYDDIVNDTEARAKMNKYNLDFGEQHKPDENVKLRLKTRDGEYDAVANIEELNKNGVSNRESWDIKEVSKNNII
jgi:hypothetical protein